jgi:hypothetical protein
MNEAALNCCGHIVYFSLWESDGLRSSAGNMPARVCQTWLQQVWRYRGVLPALQFVCIYLVTD